MSLTSILGLVTLVAHEIKIKYNVYVNEHDLFKWQFF